MRTIIATIVFSYIILYLFEIVNLHRFKLNFFNFGFNLRLRKIKMGYCQWNNKDGIYKRDVGKYVFIPESKIGYFVTKFTLLRRFGIFGYSIGNQCTIYGSFCESEGEIAIK